QQIRDWPVQDGVFFQESDVRAMRKVVVLGATVAENLFPNGDAVGQQLRVRDVPVQVIGVLAPKGQTADGGDQDDVILAPYTPVPARPRRPALQRPAPGSPVPAGGEPGRAGGDPCDPARLAPARAERAG